MGLSRLLASWFAVTAWFILWEAAGRRLARGGNGPWLRAPLWHYAGEALALTLLAALWFASLGHEGWWLVFLLLGIVAAWPTANGGKRKRGSGLRDLVGHALGVARLVTAGGILAWRLST